MSDYQNDRGQNAESGARSLPSENRTDDVESKKSKNVKKSEKKKKKTEEEKKKAQAEKEAEELKKRNSDAMTRISAPIRKKAEPEALPEEEEEPEPLVVKDRHNSSIYAMTLTVLYILLVLVASVGLSLFAIDVANDAFAFKKKGVETNVTLTGDYPTVNDLAEQLADQHIIKHPEIFKLYAKLRHKNNTKLEAGVRTATPQMGYDMLIALFTPVKQERSTISVTVPEGYTVDDIIELFVSRNIGTREGFEYVINECPYDDYPFRHNGKTYWFLEGTDVRKGQIYRIEGFLYPDTYFLYDSYPDKEGDIPGTAAAKAVIGKMLAEFNKNIKKSYLTKHKEYIGKYYPNVEFTMGDIITLASILEKEGLPAERSRISAVFYNRLNTPAFENIGGRLESNATVQYELKHLGYEVSLEFGEFEKNYESLYNTYLYGGLPAGPIVTPTRESINAALYPDHDVSYYYFVGTDSGYSFFASTLLEHSYNVTRARNGEVADPLFEIEEAPEEEYGE